MRYADRVDAGRVLAARLVQQRPVRPVVLGLPRGGVPVAAEVARALAAELDVVLVGKVGAPDSPELAVGAVGEGGVEVRAEHVLAMLRLSWSDLADTVARVRAEVAARAGRLRGGRPPRELTGRTAIVVDDGVATGATIEAAVRIVRGLGAERVVLAVPVAPAAVVRRLCEIADEVVCPTAPAEFTSVGQWYRDFTQVSESRVRELLGDRQGDEATGQVSF
ncbi:phosphoribosyltransferase [Actinokineospora enzanensis]|uniref:phosphoribosyltransferase n=1 Tax=Actinokineospora enzanensis TaxID=155975 RepID=UPI0003630719|nr:phosphoribosyltransferase family protein [Actinokineospora enzanensis]